MKLNGQFAWKYRFNYQVHILYHLAQNDAFAIAKKIYFPSVFYCHIQNQQRGEIYKKVIFLKIYLDQKKKKKIKF